MCVVDVVATIQLPQKIK